MGRTKKAKLDKLAQDMIQCKKDGFGVHYGAWRAAQWEKNKRQMPEKPKGYKHTCVHCETEFYTRINRKQKFCCDSCREEYYRIQRREKYQKKQSPTEVIYLNKTCPICGKDFKAKTHRNKYCCEFCARVAHARAIQANNQKRSANKHGEE